MFYRKFRPDLLINTFFNVSRLLSRNYVNIRQKIDNDLLLSTLEYTEINSVNDWKNLRKAVLEHAFNRGQYTSENIDALIVAHCTNARKFDLADSYLKYLEKEKIKVNIATIGRYFKLLYLKHYKNCLQTSGICSKDEENEILGRYDDLRKEYPILDSFTLENAITALSITSQWEKCLDLLRETKISAVPNSSAYSAVVSAAFLNKKEDLGWELLDEMLEFERTPLDVVFLSYLKTVSETKEVEKAVGKLEKLFLYFQENEMVCEQKVALNIDDVSRKFGYRNNFTAVPSKGLCGCCGRKLNKFELTDVEFDELKARVFENVIIGKDIFIKTDPDELDSFKRFLKTAGKFDVVLDGLNIAYSAGTNQPPAARSAVLSSVVSHFVRQDKKVLLLGRMHMKRWPKNHWSYLVENTTIFLTQNISQDDPYLLYCALNSGKDTVIVTRDLMRGHRFLLKERRYKLLFNRWLTQRQYQLFRVDNRRGPVFRVPLPFSNLAQKNGDTWHVPYEVEQKNDQDEFHKMWLCMKR